MSMLEILATILTVACVIMANYRSTLQYPVGILGTILFFFVVWNAKLYANAGLQVFFTGVQFYGWWFWLKGGVNRTKPLITEFGIERLVLWFSVALGASIVVGTILNASTNAAMAAADCMVFGLSVFAQFLLDRKKIETWVIWGAVNAGSVYLYYNQGLYIFTALYIGLFINCFIAWRMWRNEQYQYAIDQKRGELIADGIMNPDGTFPGYDPTTGEPLVKA